MLSKKSLRKIDIHLMTIICTICEKLYTQTHVRINTIKGHEQTIKVNVDKFDYLKIKISLQTYHEQSKNPIYIMGGNN